MTPLRQRMVDAMVTRGFADRTQESYVEAISRMARHYHRSPALLSKDEVSAYLLDMVSLDPVTRQAQKQQLHSHRHVKFHTKRRRTQRPSIRQSVCL